MISRFTAYYSQARSLESRKNKVTIIVSEIVCVFVSELNRMRIERYGAKLTYDNADVDVDIDVNEREDPPARLQEPFCFLTILSVGRFQGVLMCTSRVSHVSISFERHRRERDCQSPPKRS